MNFSIDLGKPAQWQEILDVSHAAFGYDNSFFPKYYPHSYPGKVAAKHFITCSTTERIIGVINQTPLKFRIGPAKLTGIGIGGVAALPEASGQGVMSSMMKSSNERQRQKGTHIGILWGLRDRYRRFGFETAGTQHLITISLRNLRNTKAVPMRRLKKDDASRISAMAGKESFSIVRNAAWQTLLLMRGKFRAYGNKEGKLSAYICANKDQPANRLETAGSPEILPGLILSYMKRMKLEKVGILFSRANSGHRELALESDCITGVSSTQLAIYNFEGLLEQLQPLLAQRFQEQSIRRRVRICKTDEGAAYDLEMNKGGHFMLQKATGVDNSELAFDSAEWVRLLFPPPGGSLLPGKHDPRLLEAFHLPLLVPTWDGV